MCLLNKYAEIKLAKFNSRIESKFHLPLHIKVFKWIYVLVGKGKKDTRIKADCHGRGTSTAHLYWISLYFI